MVKFGIDVVRGFFEEPVGCLAGLYPTEGLINYEKICICTELIVTEFITIGICRLYQGFGEGSAFANLGGSFWLVGAFRG